LGNEAREAERMDRHYYGAEIDVFYDVDRCIHAQECVHGLPEVFDRGRRPWVLPDAGTAEAITETILRCPSGALRYHRTDGVEEIPDADTTVTPMPDGPIYVRGDIAVRMPDGSTESVTRAVLCGCGRSARKPFCDLTHVTPE
jgi:uncharacterized Fe-S cluster protein YjdI